MPRFAPYGVIRGVLPVPVELLTGTSAREFLTDLTLGHQFVVEQVDYIVKVVHTGTGGSQTIRVIKGASTVVASRTIVLADAGTDGANLSMTLTAADAAFTDGDTLTVDMTAAGTAFTLGAGLVVIRYRQEPQRIA